MPKLIIAFPCTDSILQKAASAFELKFAKDTNMSVEELLKEAQSFQPEALLVSVIHRIDSKFIQKLPDTVKVIATCSVGFDHLDRQAAAARGIVLTNTPDVLTDATADLAFLHILGASRRLREHLHVAENGWGHSLGQNELLGHDMTRKKLGIFGMGRIGQAVADRARGFGMEVLYCNRRRLPSEQEKTARYFSNLDEMLPHCDILTLHAPGGAETKHIMNDRSFSLLPKGAIFVNVARGSLVDEKAMVRALKSGQLFAAGLDVFENEPFIDPELIQNDRVLLTPHTGSATIETRSRMGFLALENIAAVLNGKKPLSPISN